MKRSTFGLRLSEFGKIQSFDFLKIDLSAEFFQGEAETSWG